MLTVMLLAHAEVDWVCTPGRDDVCAAQPYVELRRDGTLEKKTFTPDRDAPVDCFYLYPTVDLGLRVGNHDDRTDRLAFERAVRLQGALFGSVCRVWAPTYRQVTLGTYFVRAARSAEAFARASADVDAAFDAFLAALPPERGFVLLGHSQGGQQVGNLVRRIEADPALAARLVAAYPIGWRTATPADQPVGGSFQRTRACADEDDTGCFVAYRTYTATPSAKRTDAFVEGASAVCVNPARPGSTTHERLTGAVTYGPSAYVPAYDPARDGLLVIRDAWQGRCAPTPDGAGMIVRWSPTAGDERPDLLELDHQRWMTPMGSHILDMQLTLLDLVEDVRRRAAAWRPAG